MISVIVPIYNAEEYLQCTIDCLLRQTETDFEAIFINDGSTDRSGVLCKEIARRDPRFRYIEQENLGVSAARNHGMAQARGEYITFIDADDVIGPEYLKTLLEALLGNDCQMAVCDVAVITDGQETCRFSCADGVLSRNDALNLLLRRTGINSGPCAKLYRRELLDGVQYPPLKAYEDILFVLDVMDKCGRVAATTKTAYRYIQNSGGAMSSYRKVPSEDVITAAERILAFLKKERQLDPACFYITVSHLMQYVQTLAGNDSGEAKAFISSARRLIRENGVGICRCSAFPWKEKVVYAMFACGWLYHEKKLRRLR